MNIKELEKELLSYGVENPREEALIIIERLFNKSRAALMLEGEIDFSSPELYELLKKRREHIPLQYILGSWEFMGKEFCVSPDCLIPRPDTEILVEKALEILKKGEDVAKNAKCKMQNAKLMSQDVIPSGAEESMGLSNSFCPSTEGVETSKRACDVADLCTGSGCIGLSLLMYSDIDSLTLMDIFEGALNMAMKNAQRHNLQSRCQFILGDITKDMPKRKFDMIVSNPPYIPSTDIEGLSCEVKKEPILALDGGEDGLDIIRFLIGEGLTFLKENGCMLIEFGYDQGDVMDTLLREKCDTGSIKSYEILYDYGKNPRVAVIYK